MRTETPPNGTKAAKGDQDEKERIFEGWHLVALFVAFARVVRMWGDFKSDGDADAYGDINANADTDTYFYIDTHSYTNIYPHRYTNAQSICFYAF